MNEEDLFLGLQVAALEDNTALPPNTNLEILMGSWSRQAGFPIVTASRDYNSTGNVTFSQRRFMSEPSAMPDNSIFWVPLFVGLPSDPSNEIGNRPTLWISNSEESLQISELTNVDWLIVNKLSSGLYRVLYDRQNYQLISNALIDDYLQFSTADRTALIDDLYIFAENELVTYDVFFDLIQYMQTEQYYEVW